MNIVILKYLESCQDAIQFNFYCIHFTQLPVDKKFIHIIDHPCRLDYESCFTAKKRITMERFHATIFKKNNVVSKLHFIYTYIYIKYVCVYACGVECSFKFKLIRSCSTKTSIFSSNLVQDEIGCRVEIERDAGLPLTYKLKWYFSKNFTSSYNCPRIFLLEINGYNFSQWALRGSFS